MAEAIDDGLIKALEEIVAKDRTGFGRAALANVAREALSRHKAQLSVAGHDVAPIPMMLFCPKCGLQHIDMPDPTDDWDNPPHKSHKCVGPNGCGTVWRPADVPTEGVAAIQTRGSKDTVFYNHAALTARQPVAGDEVGLAERIATIIAFNRNKSNFEIARTILTALQVTEGDKVERLTASFGLVICHIAALIDAGRGEEAARFLAERAVAALHSKQEGEE